MCIRDRDRWGGKSRLSRLEDRSTPLIHVMWLLIPMHIILRHSQQDVSRYSDDPGKPGSRQNNDIIIIFDIIMLKTGIPVYIDQKREQWLTNGELGITGHQCVLD